MRVGEDLILRDGYGDAFRTASCRHQLSVTSKDFSHRFQVSNLKAAANRCAESRWVQLCVWVWTRFTETKTARHLSNQLQGHASCLYDFSHFFCPNFTLAVGHLHGHSSGVGVGIVSADLGGG